MDEYQRRRADLLRHLPPHSLVLLAGNARQYQSAGIWFPFYANTDLLYLTGWAERDAALVIRKIDDARHHMTLYVRPRRGEEGLGTVTRDVRDAAATDGAMARALPATPPATPPPAPLSKALLASTDPAVQAAVAALSEAERTALATPGADAALYAAGSGASGWEEPPLGLHAACAIYGADAACDITVGFEGAVRGEIGRLAQRLHALPPASSIDADRDHPKLLTDLPAQITPSFLTGHPLGHALSASPHGAGRVGSARQRSMPVPVLGQALEGATPPPPPPPPPPSMPTAAWAASSSSPSPSQPPLLPASAIAPLRPHLDRLRVRKSPAELILMRAAAQATVVAHNAVYANCRPEAGEGGVYAAWEAAMRQQALEPYVASAGAGVGASGAPPGDARPPVVVPPDATARSAYVPVVASGVHALTIHYTANDRPTLDTSGKGFVLLDAGARVHGYVCDVTRTWPGAVAADAAVPRDAGAAVRRAWTPAQRALYDVVLRVQLRAIAWLATGTAANAHDADRFDVPPAVQWALQQHRGSRRGLASTAPRPGTASLATLHEQCVAWIADELQALFNAQTSPAARAAHAAAAPARPSVFGERPVHAVTTSLVRQTVFPHFIGHFIGLDVHDAPTVSMNVPLGQGHVVTVEPGVYIPWGVSWAPPVFWGCGIRVEDVVALGAVVDGRRQIEVLTQGADKTYAASTPA
ncbi:hypothetical protein CXG81DRAFT_25696 [Caulochytrium protostelioides]|nr:hypothetical protein CXG81DRAFT_25696 [Caulochytrium protostelioides]|eukprot:RKP01601.1 hypothetical protein CXG81DRAFT_25696 [Caulochytrium protostelioides]